VACIVADEAELELDLRGAVLAAEEPCGGCPGESVGWSADVAYRRSGRAGCGLRASACRAGSTGGVSR
jgi:hypothetical protein